MYQPCLFEEWLDPTLKIESDILPQLLLASSYLPIDFFCADLDPLTSPSFSTATTSSSPEIEQFLFDHQLVFQQDTKKKTFPCHVCYRSFARKHDLQRHIRVHTGAKPYSCLSCNKSFARTDALKRHLRMEEKCRTSPVIQAMKETGSRRYRNL